MRMLNWDNFKNEIVNKPIKDKEFISLTDEWQKVSFVMTNEPIQRFYFWDGKKSTRVDENDEHNREKWWMSTTDGKLCSFTRNQFLTFLNSLPKDVPDIYECELKKGINEKGHQCLKVRQIT